MVYFKELTQHSLGGTEENHENSIHNIPGWESNQASPEHKTGALREPSYSACLVLLW
jgi:hypothetical protein